MFFGSIEIFGLYVFEYNSLIIIKLGRCNFFVEQCIPSKAFFYFILFLYN